MKFRNPFRGPRGERGEPGFPGPQGPMGMTGPEIRLRLSGLNRGLLSNRVSVTIPDQWGNPGRGLLAKGFDQAGNPLVAELSLYVWPDGSVRIIPVPKDLLA